MTDFGVPFQEWEPVYAAILEEFGYDRSADEAARDELGAMTGDDGLGPSELPDAAGRTVAIAGGASGLREELSTAAAADLVVGASTASETLLTAGIDVDIHVTDLDKDEAVVRVCSETGVPVAVHAHGDNRPALSRLVPTLDPRSVFPTTQAAPIDGVTNPGGFTDGDRAAFLADALGASRMTFPGWDLDDPSVSAEKRRKLGWAARLLRWLELRRNEHFSILDDRREGVALPPGVLESRED